MTRVEAGVSDGGQWTVQKRREQVGDLLRRPAFSRDNDAYRARLAARLEREGYVPAASIITEAVPGDYSSRERNTFWNNGVLTAEYAGIAKFMDKQEGKAYRERRTTHQTNDLAVTLPSRDPILQQMAFYNTNTIDIPVVAMAPGSGAPQESWYRVTKTPSGGWRTRPVDGGTSLGHEITAEAITKVLEARRVKTALQDVDLVQAVTDRVAAQGSKQIPLVSRFITSASFNDAAKTLSVNIRGTQYGYKATRQMFDALVSSGRPGSVYNAIKSAGTRTNVDSCSDCGRVFAVNGVRHDCTTVKVTSNAKAQKYESKLRARGVRSAARRLFSRRR